jgi:hypothetical protein
MRQKNLLRNNKYQSWHQRRLRGTIKQRGSAGNVTLEMEREGNVLYNCDNSIGEGSRYPGCCTRSITVIMKIYYSRYFPVGKF